MTSSDILINALKSFEGCKLTAYWDKSGKVWTIGFGHTGGVKQGQTITTEQAVAYLRSDLKRFETYVNNLGVCKNQGQFDALVDFSYNCGHVYDSILKLIKSNASVSSIQAALLKINTSGGTVLSGLTRRRKWEGLRYAEDPSAQSMIASSDNGGSYGATVVYKEADPNKVYLLSSATKNKNTILQQSDDRKSAFEALQKTMMNNTPEMGREIYLSAEMYSSNILKGTQESKKEKV